MPCYVGASLCFVAVVHIGAPSGRPEMYYLAITKCCFESLTLSCGFFNLHYNIGGENIKAGLGGVRRALIMLYDGCLITLEDGGL